MSIFFHASFCVSLPNTVFFSTAFKNWYFNAMFCDNVPFSDKKRFCTLEYVMRSIEVRVYLSRPYHLSI